MALTRLKTWISEILTAADLNAEFDNILTKINGNLGNTEISSGDPIQPSKLSASSAFAAVTMRFSIAGAGGWPAAGAIFGANGFGFAAFPATTGDVWYPVRAMWQTNNCGHVAGVTAAFNISWGYCTIGAATWTSTQNITSAATTMTAPTLDHAGQQGFSTLDTATALTVSAQARGFCIVSTAADANVMSVATDVFSCTVLLKRQIIA